MKEAACGNVWFRTAKWLKELDLERFRQVMS
jgi:hypothetical protein